ncbi:hypothetical protein FACS189472_01080 [Alphaproteobacteria bacterium]|nr:hypothetical protein FACS189472_01080 [Alphaproteobacteria bacterium]
MVGAWDENIFVVDAKFASSRSGGDSPWLHQVVSMARKFYILIKGNASPKSSVPEAKLDPLLNR